MRTDDNTAALYRADSAVIAFGGGFDAMHGSTSWDGTLTESEQARLDALLREHGWWAGEPDAPAVRSDERRWRVEVAGPDGRHRFAVDPAAPGAAAIHALLDTAARRRHEALLESLPKAGRRR